MNVVRLIIFWLVVVLCGMNVITRNISAQTYAMLEKDWPRIANLLRLARAIGPDVIKGLKALYLIVTGQPWPNTLPAELSTPVPLSSRQDPPPQNNTSTQ